MVSEAEFDKNQAKFANAREKFLAQGQAAANAPIDPTGQMLVDTVASGAILAAGGAALSGGGTILGSSGTAAQVGSAGRSAISNAARGAYQEAIANGASKSAAAAAARVAAAKASSNAALMGGSYLKWLGETVAKMSIKKTIGFGVGTALTIGVFDVVRGILTDKQAGASTLENWYVNGVINKTEYDTELGKLDLGDQTKFYAEAAELAKETKAMTDMEKELMVSVVPDEFRTIPGESQDQRLQAFVQQGKEDFARKQPGNAQGLSVAQIQQTNQQFEQGRVAGEVERQKQQSLQKKPPTMEELQGVPTGQLSPTDMERIIKAQTPNEPVQPSAKPQASSQPNVTPSSPASLQFRTKAQFEQARGQSVTDEEWNRYLRTGRFK